MILYEPRLGIFVADIFMMVQKVLLNSRSDPRRVSNISLGYNNSTSQEEDSKAAHLPIGKQYYLDISACS